VVAAISAEHAPGRRVVLVESDQRKATFLRQAIATLGLTAARVEVARIEDLPPLEADVVSARALAPLDRLCGFAERHMLATGTALFPKGAGHLAELDAARVHWRFSETLHPSKTDPAAAIVELKELSRV
jgi:16S rRNA (guanine527-N7)-methyltransferase